MPRLDVQAEVRRRLAEELRGVDVRVSVPNPRPATLVVVRREGGAMQDALIDRAGVGVDVWAPTEAGASALAGRVSDAMAALPFSGGFARVDEETVRSDYDVARKSPRWYLSYTIRTYVPR